MTTRKQAQLRKKAASCRTKGVFPTLESAQRVAGRMNARDKRVKPYQCDICGKWHICARNKVAVLTELFDRIERERSAD